ncbi:MAG TPA: hypothetical protein VGC76_11850 [Pyrinomonadaceae bacterium]|jgi:hypothetical protein
MADDKNQNEVLLAAYSEVCRSYHAIDDFRTKLLGFLPLTSLAGIFLLDTSKMIPSQGFISHELFGFAAIFAASLTLALFGYEIRGMQRTHHLVREGTHLEEQLRIGHGHFHVCKGEHDNSSAIANIFNAKMLASVIYSVVFAAWLFIALRLGFGIGTLTCSICAVVVGLFLAVCVSFIIRKLIPA